MGRWLAFDERPPRPVLVVLIRSRVVETACGFLYFDGNLLLRIGVYGYEVWIPTRRGLAGHRPDASLRRNDLENIMVNGNYKTPKVHQTASPAQLKTSKSARR